MKIVGTRLIHFERPYGTLEDAPLPPSGGRHGDRREYLKAWRRLNAEKVKGYTQAQIRRRRLAA